MPKLYKWLGISAVVIALDLYTKQLIQKVFQFGEQLRITNFLDIVHFHNEGAAFGFLNNAGGWQKWFFTSIAAVASLVIIYLLKKHQNEKLFCFGLALILGGALGNAIDRMRFGYVVDFIHAHWNQAYFPAFNVADAAISIGAALIILDALLNWRRDRQRTAP